MQVMAGAAHGGAETFFERLVPALARSGLEQKTVIRTNATRADILRKAGVEPVELPFGGLLDFTTRRSLANITREFQPDVQLAWMNRAARFCRPHGHILAGRMGGYYSLKYYKHCHHLVGNTVDIRDYIVRSGWAPHKAWYLPNFVDAKRADPVDRTTLATPADAPLIVALGRLHDNKAFDVLLAALAEISDAFLWLAGDGPKEEFLRKEATRLGLDDRVRFLGWRDDIAALIGAADVFVCPSRHEPLGNVVIEAWAHKKPVVAASSAGPAALIDDGVSGLLVPVDNAQGLARGIKRVLESPALAGDLAAAGHAEFQAKFTETAVVAQYQEFFDQVTA